MAVVDTAKSANNYAHALKLLLPPGEYFSGGDVDNITLWQAQELARIHAKVDIGFNIDTSEETLGWRLADYRALLADGGMTDFEVFDHYRLPMVAGLKVGKPLGDVVNVSVICMHYKLSQQALFNALMPTLNNHKLSHTRILAVSF